MKKVIIFLTIILANILITKETDIGPALDKKTRIACKKACNKIKQNWNGKVICEFEQESADENCRCECN